MYSQSETNLLEVQSLLDYEVIHGEVPPRQNRQSATRKGPFPAKSSRPTEPAHVFQRQIGRSQQFESTPIEVNSITFPLPLSARRMKHPIPLPRPTPAAPFTWLWRSHPSSARPRRHHPNQSTPAKDQRTRMMGPRTTDRNGNYPQSCRNQVWRLQKEGAGRSKRNTTELPECPTDSH